MFRLRRCFALKQGTSFLRAIKNQQRREEVGCGGTFNQEGKHLALRLQGAYWRGQGHGAGTYPGR